MSDAAVRQTAQARQSAAAAAGRVDELKVSGNLMRLETGLYCIVNKPMANADLQSGLPGVRLSLPPGVDSRPEQVEITTFRADGWLSGFGDAALVRVQHGPAHVLVTIYQAPNHAETAPNIQVVKLLDSTPPRTDAASRAQAAAQPGMRALDEAQGASHIAAAGAAAMPADLAEVPRVMDMVAHIQGEGDVGALIGDRLGEVGSKRWIEGFAIAPAHDIAPSDIEYQAVLGRGWLSPWVEGGEFCGSRGMALPVLGLKVRLRGDAARDFECTYTASFTDGTQTALVPAGAACESESLAPLESFQIVIRSRAQAAAPRVATARAAEPIPKAAPTVAAKPVPKTPASKVVAPKPESPKSEPSKPEPSKVGAKPAPRRR